MDLLIPILVSIGIILFFMAIRGQLNPQLIRRNREAFSKSIAENYWNNRRNLIHHQFVDECQRRGVKNIDKPEDMQTALRVLKYDSRFSTLDATTDNVRDLFKKVRLDEEQAEKLKLQAAEIEQKRKKQDCAAYGEDVYEILCTLREDTKNWTKHIGKGIVAVMECGRFEFDMFTRFSSSYELQYYVISGKQGLFTYSTKTGIVHPGKPDCYVKGEGTFGMWPEQKERGAYYHVCVGFTPSPKYYEELKILWVDEKILSIYREYNPALPRAPLAEKEGLVVGNNTRAMCECFASMIRDL